MIWRHDAFKDCRMKQATNVIINLRGGESWGKKSDKLKLQFL